MMNHESVNGFDYLSSLMKRLSLSHNRQGDNETRESAVLVPNEYQLNNHGAPNNYYDNQQVIIGNNTGLSDYYPQIQSGSSSSSSNRNSGFNFRSLYTNALAVALALNSSYIDRLLGGSLNSKCYTDGEKIILTLFCINPIAVMCGEKYYYRFMKLLNSKVISKNVINHILIKLEEFSDDLLALISCDEQGSQVVKKLIHVAKKSPKVDMFPNIFASKVVYLMNDQLGKQVVQACFDQLGSHKNTRLYEEVVKNWWSIATGKYGSIAIQECMDYMGNSPCFVNGVPYASPKDRLLMEISDNAALLAVDFHGNFVLQRVIVMNYPLCKDVIAENLRTVYVILCYDKSGSFLVEKCLEQGNPYRTYVAEELLKSNQLVSIVQNGFGNYVIQKLLKETKVHDDVMFQKLCKKLMQDMAALEFTPYSRNVANFLKNHSSDKVNEECY